MSKSRALANQERELQARRLSRLARAVLLATATAMTFLTATLLVADHLYRPDSFVIEQIKLKGKFQHLKPEDVQSAVHQGSVGNYFSVELDDIKQRVEEMDWVRSADVRREWPNTLLVSVKEHRPAMRWNSIVSGEVTTTKGEKWVSLAGKVITLKEPLGLQTPLVLNGPDHNAREILIRAVQWRKKLAVSGIKIQSITLSASQAWSLELAYVGADKVFELLLGRENVEHRLDRFQALFDRQFKHADAYLVRVDARYPDGLAVEEKMRENATIDDSVGSVSLSFNSSMVTLMRTNTGRSKV